MVAEVSYLVGSRLGVAVESRFIAGLADLDVRAPEPEDWKRISVMVQKYAHLPLGAIDASLVVLAERLRTPVIITTDHRHFGVVRTATGQSFELLPKL